MDKPIYIQGILLCHKKKNEVLTYATTWMDLKNIMLSEISQKQKQKYYIIPLILSTQNR